MRMKTGVIASLAKDCKVAVLIPRVMAVLNGLGFGGGRAIKVSLIPVHGPAAILFLAGAIDEFTCNTSWGSA